MTSLEKRPLYTLAQDESKYLKRLMNKVHPDNTKISETFDRYLKEVVYLNTCKLNHKIPRQIVCLDEKYLRHCLEMIHISAAKSGTCKISLHTSSLKGGISLEGFRFPLAQNIDPSDSAGCFVKCSLPTGSENVNYSPPGHWIIGSINGSKSMKNILKSPTFHRLGVLDDDKDDSDFAFLNSGSLSNICSSQKLHNDKVVLGDNIYRSTRHSRFGSMSGTNASEEQMSCPGANVSHGMLQCTLTDGKPHYVFSVDEKREVYEANLLLAESSANEVMQWMYSFNLHNGSRKEGQAASTKKLSQVGTMKVSDQFSKCPNNFKILETEFVLYGHDDNSKDESQPLSQGRMNRGLSKRFVSTFKPSFSVRRRTNSASLTCSWTPPTEVHNILGAPLGKTRALKKQTQPYCEIAAIIIRKHVLVPPQVVSVAETGGWGVNILKRVSLKDTFFSSHQLCSNSYCSTTDIIIPAGYHSQPETGGAIPSSLVERWKTGGRCECGGWDLGCPLTIYNKQEVFAPNDNQKEHTSFDVILKGTKRHPPQLKMVKISSDLYYLKFQSSLSSLQCLAIAVAVLHCQNATLQSQMVKKLESSNEEVVKDVESFAREQYYS
ncbi:hypothetical protein QQ045_030459 [Rhodiola kirilowii]